MKDFDAARPEVPVEDRQCRFRGLVLTARRAVRPEALAAFRDAAPGSAAQDLLDYEAFISAALEPESASEWGRMRADESDPVSLQEVEDMVRWLVERASGRPTSAPSHSTRGRTPAEDTSKAA